MEESVLSSSQHFHLWINLLKGQVERLGSEAMECADSTGGDAKKKHRAQASHGRLTKQPSDQVLEIPNHLASWEGARGPVRKRKPLHLSECYLSGGILSATLGSCEGNMRLWTVKALILCTLEDSLLLTGNTLCIVPATPRCSRTMC